MSAGTHDPKNAKALYNAAGESRVVYTEQEENDARARGFTKGYEFTEYPKSLYQGGDRTAAERVVRDADEERAARADGFKMIDQKADARSVAALADPVEEKPAEPKKKTGK